MTPREYPKLQTYEFVEGALQHKAAKWSYILVLQYLFEIIKADC